MLRRWLIRKGSRFHAALLVGLRFPGFLGRNVLVLTIDGHEQLVPVPLRYAEIGENLYVVASFGGNDDPPGWFIRLSANPQAEIQRKGARDRVTARVLRAEDTVTIWPLLLARYCNYARE